MGKLTDDQIKWTLVLDAGGVQGEINTIMSSTNQLEKTNRSLEKSIKATEKEMSGMAKEMTTLEKEGKSSSVEYKKLADAYDASAQNIAEFKTEIASNTSTINANRKSVGELEKGMKIEDMTMRQLTQRAKELSSQLEVTSQSSNPDDYKKLSKELSQVQGRMGDLKNYSGGLSSALSSIPGPIGGVINGIKGMGAAFKLLILNPVGLVLMAIVAAFYLLKTAIAGSDEATTKLNGVMAGISVVFDSVKRVVTETVAALWNLITLDFEGLKQNINNMSDLAENTVANTKAAYEAAIAEDALNDAIARNNDVTKINQARISELRQISQDTTKSLKERMAASNELMALERQNYQMSLSNISGLYKNWKDNNRNLTDAMKRSSGQQFAEVEKYMKMVQEGTELTIEQRLKLANLVNDITSTLDDGSDEQKEKFRSFFNDMSDTQREYFDGSRRDAKQAAIIQKEAAEEAFNNRLGVIERHTKKELIAINKLYMLGRITEAEQAARTRQAQTDELDKRLQLYKKYGKDLTDIQLEISNNQLTNQKAEMDAELAAIDQRVKDDLLLEDEMYVNKTQSLTEYEANSKEIQRKSLEDKIALTRKYGLSTAELERQLLALGIEDRKTAEKKIIDNLKKANAEQFKVLEGNKKLEKKQLDRDFADGKISKTTYNNEILALDTKYAKLRLGVEQLNLQSLRTLHEQGVAGAEEAIAESTEKIKGYSQEVSDAVLTQTDGTKGQLTELAEYFNDLKFDGPAGALTAAFGNAFSEIAKLREKDNASWTDYVGAIGSILGGVGQAVSEYTSLIFEEETASLESEKQKQLTIAGNSASQREAVEKEYAQKELDLKKKQAAANAGIQSAQLWIGTATGIASAWASAMSLGPIAGPIAAGVLTAALLATAGIQEAAILKQRDAILNTTLDSSGGSSSDSRSSSTSFSLKEGYADGGYTGDGGKYEVAGMASDGQPIHKGEYVVAQEEMANPRVIPLVSAIEHERQKRKRMIPSNTPGYSDGGYTGKNGTDEVTGQLLGVVLNLADQVEKMKNTPLKVNYDEFSKADDVMSNLKTLAKRGN